jgi:ribosomal protein S18 acetylase RimI-like enzyme
MSDITALGPGGPVPAWVRALELEIFGEAWGPLAPHERLWILPEVAFARWTVVEAAGEAELLRIAVAPEARGRGLGRRVLEASQIDLQILGVEELHLEVRDSNATAQSLYRACGWREVGLRKGYYGDGEDARLFERRG